jgi:hypothetical protein
MSDPMKARDHAQRITLLDEDDVRQMVRDDMPIAGCTTQQEWARKNGISPQYLSDFMTGRKAPGPSILKALMLKRTVTYEAADD